MINTNMMTLIYSVQRLYWVPPRTASQMQPRQACVWPSFLCCGEHSFTFLFSCARRRSRFRTRIRRKQVLVAQVLTGPSPRKPSSTYALLSTFQSQLFQHPISVNLHWYIQSIEHGERTLLKWRLSRRNAVLSKPPQHVIVTLVVICYNPVITPINISRVSDVSLILRSQSVVIVEGKPVVAIRQMNVVS